MISKLTLWPTLSLYIYDHEIVPTFGDLANLLEITELILNMSIHYTVHCTATSIIVKGCRPQHTTT